MQLDSGALGLEMQIPKVNTLWDHLGTLFFNVQNPCRKLWESLFLEIRLLIVMWFLDGSQRNTSEQRERWVPM